VSGLRTEVRLRGILKLLTLRKIFKNLRELRRTTCLVDKEGQIKEYERDYKWLHLDRGYRRGNS